MELNIVSSAQESGPNEDHHCFSQSHHIEVVEECTQFHPRSGVHEITRDHDDILKFLDVIPSLCEQEDTYGLIWDTSLSPSHGQYESGKHYCSSQEKDRKSSNGSVTFHRDGRTGIMFAVKSLLPHVKFNPKEITIGLSKGHPNICSVYGIIVRLGRVHILLEHAGRPLIEQREWIAESRDCILQAAKQCFSALEFLSSNNLVHCDIKPDNFTVVGDRNDFTIKLIDFGSCQKRGTQLPKHAHTTKEYWSPEVWQALDQKRVIVCDPCMDMYAVALTLYFIQTSHHLTQRIQGINDVMTKMPGYIKMVALPDSLPADLRVVMGPCLEDDPTIRLTASNAAKALQDVTVLTRSLKKTSLGSVQSTSGTGKPSPAYTQPAISGISPPDVGTAQTLLKNWEGLSGKYKESWALLLEKGAERPITPAARAVLTSAKRLKASFKSLPPIDSTADPSVLSNVGSCKELDNYESSILTNKEKVVRHSSTKHSYQVSRLGKNKNLSKNLISFGKGMNNHEPTSVQSSYPVSSWLKTIAMKVQANTNHGPGTGQSQANFQPAWSNKKEDRRFLLNSHAKAKRLQSTQCSVLSERSKPSQLSTEKLPITQLSVTNLDTVVNPETKAGSPERASRQDHCLSESQVATKSRSLDMEDDDIDFVLEALDDKAITGKDDDITDRLFDLCQSLPDYDQARYTEGDIRNVVMNTNTPRSDERTTGIIMRSSGCEQLNRESMDVSSPEEPSISQCSSGMSSQTSNAVLHAFGSLPARSHDMFSKKRSGEPSQCREIPEKVMRKDLLPDFNQI